MSRWARSNRVFFFEEPLFENADPHLREAVCADTGVHVVTPILPHELSEVEIIRSQQKLLLSLLTSQNINKYVAWYYTPMAWSFSNELQPRAIIYDCMDELSHFADAPPELRANEQALFKEADLVFTGGASLYASKRSQHGAVYLFPSSIDVPHFARAQSIDLDPEDQAPIPKPRLGYAGVIDERMDLDLIRTVAEDRPDWSLVLLGPVVKINDKTLPQAPNIHYLGMKQYAMLPEYLSGWNIGMLPFALNDSTRFISPTKTPEYLAAGLQVISTPIRDVVSPYGDLGLVGIANNARDFIRIADLYLSQARSDMFQKQVDAFLSQSSWDSTWNRMRELIENVVYPRAVRHSSNLDQEMKGVTNV